MKKKDYDSTIARIAGNVAPALIHKFPAPGGVMDGDEVAAAAVALARAIVAEVQRTEPEEPSHG